MLLLQNTGHTLHTFAVLKLRPVPSAAAESCSMVAGNLRGVTVSCCCDHCTKAELIESPFPPVSEAVKSHFQTRAAASPELGDSPSCMTDTSQPNPGEGSVQDTRSPT